MRKIQQLTPRLANQIDIEMKSGSVRLIRIRDNGSGIPKDDLSLALSRHATSKIKDLEAVGSLSFRGEALASIRSASRLTLTSNVEGQESRWKVFAEGQDMETVSSPARRKLCVQR